MRDTRIANHVLDIKEDKKDTLQWDEKSKPIFDKPFLAEMILPAVDSKGRVNLECIGYGDARP